MNRKRVIIRHVGTAHTQQELNELIILAREFITTVSKQLSLFEEDRHSSHILSLNTTDFIGVYFTFMYDLLHKLIHTIGFNRINSRLLLDLVVIRMIEPASKLRSIELIEEYFGIKHRRQSYYESALKWIELKSKVERITLNFATRQYAFEFDLLFYDVTTLYFETFQEDDLRKNGFSKDNKSEQPQIIVALMVNKEGFPVAYEIFSGNTFEGHTIIPVVKAFISKNGVKSFTIVADAAMISADNIKALRNERINYIVGARLGNLSHELIQQIDKITPREDGKSIRLETDNGFLICSYSSLRYRKDKHEMIKQIQKAQDHIDNPSKNKRLKFTKSAGEKLELNQKLIDKAEKLLGIKGYYTNLAEDITDNQTIINRYHDLYKIEQAFRVSKSDLKTRPVFHFKEDPIKLHMIICFMALVITKHIEIQTNISIKKFIHECKKVKDARLLNKVNNKEYRIRSKLNENIQKLLDKLQIC